MRLKLSRRRPVIRLLIAGAAGAILLVAGCSVRQPSDPVMPPSVEVPNTWVSQPEGKARNLAAGWLADFEDPRLEAIVAEALENNQDLQIAAAQLEVARQAAVKAGARLYPLSVPGPAPRRRAAMTAATRPPPVASRSTSPGRSICGAGFARAKRPDSRTSSPPSHNTRLPVSRWLRRRPRPGSWLSKTRCRLNWQSRTSSFSSATSPSPRPDTTRV